MEKSKRIITSYSDHRGWYMKGQKRLQESIQANAGSYDSMLFNPSNLPNVPDHKVSPYGFKLYAMVEAAKTHEIVQFIDSSIYLVGCADPLFDEAEARGWHFEEAGHMVGTWTNDATLEYFGISRDEAMQIPMFSAGFITLDFRNETAVEFFTAWTNAMAAGHFQGQWTNVLGTESKDVRCQGHRHDMSCASIIAYLLGMELSKPKYMCYIGQAFGEPLPTAMYYAQGMA